MLNYGIVSCPGIDGSCGWWQFLNKLEKEVERKSYVNGACNLVVHEKPGKKMLVLNDIGLWMIAEVRFPGCLVLNVIRKKTSKVTADEYISFKFKFLSLWVHSSILSFKQEKNACKNYDNPKTSQYCLKTGDLGNQIERSECNVKIDVIPTIIDFTKAILIFSTQWIYLAMLYHRREWWHVKPIRTATFQME